MPFNHPPTEEGGTDSSSNFTVVYLLRSSVMDVKHFKKMIRHTGVHDAVQRCIVGAQSGGAEHVTIHLRPVGEVPVQDLPLGFIAISGQSWFVWVTAMLKGGSICIVRLREDGTAYFQ